MALHTSPIKKFLLNRFFLTADRNTWYTLFFVKILGRLKLTWRGYGIVPFNWIDQSDVFRLGILRSESDQVAIGPCRIDSKNAKREIVKAPEICWRHFRNVYVNASCSAIFNEQKKLYLERVGRGSQSRFNYSGPHLRCLNNKFAIVKICGKQTIDQGISFGGNGSFNYYHWLIEIVTKGQFLKDLPDDYLHYPLLVNHVVSETPSFIHSLSKISHGRKIHYLNPKEPYFVKNLVFIDALNNLPFNLFGSDKFIVSDFLFRAETVTYLRKVFLEPLIDHSDYLHNRFVFPKKIFLARGNSRRMYNQDEVKNTLEKYGFVSIEMESFTFDEQVLLFNNADYIVGPTGAAWTNIVFAKEGSKCICWMPEEYGDFSAYSTLSNLVGVELKYMIYETGVMSTSDLYCKEYLINIGLLEQALKTIGATSN